MVPNNRVNICCKAVMAKILTAVYLIVELSKATVKPKGI